MALPQDPRTDSIRDSISQVAYSPGVVKWTSSRLPSTDRLRLSFTPHTVTAGGVLLPKRHVSLRLHLESYQDYRMLPLSS